MSERDPRGFPLQAGERERVNGRIEQQPRVRIPWSAAEIAYAEYAAQYGTMQSLERLAERGGFGRDEFIGLLVEAAAREASGS
jgi:hypothetical protein